MRRILSATNTRLASGTPYWPVHNGPLPRARELKENLEGDVAVIGGGITGALISHELASAGLDVILLEQRRFASGSTSASTALLSFEYDLLFTELIQRIGERAAVQAHELSQGAMERVQTLVDRVGNSCGFEEKTSLRVAQRPELMSAFEEEVEAFRKHGFKHRLLGSLDLKKEFGILGYAAIASPKAAQIDPYRLARSLIDSASQRGLQAFENAKVSVVDAGKRCVELKTTSGFRVSGTQVIFATGYESEKYLDRSLGRLNSDFCFISHPIQDISPLAPCLFVEHAENYIYVSTFGNRVMVGMEDRSFRDPGVRSHWLVSNAKKLERRFAEFVPDQPLKPEFRWAATFAKSKDSLPYLGQDRRFPRAWFVLGYGGNGIASSAMLAPLVCRLVTGGRCPEAELFRFDR